MILNIAGRGVCLSNSICASGIGVTLFLYLLGLYCIAFLNLCLAIRNLVIQLLEAKQNITITMQRKTARKVMMRISGVVVSLNEFS